MQKKVNNLETKILTLNNEISDLETENERLWKLVDKPQSSSSYNTPTYDIPTYSEIRYDTDWKSNIGGLNVNIYSFGFLEPKPDKFSIDLDVEYARGGKCCSV